MNYPDGKAKREKRAFHKKIGEGIYSAMVNRPQNEKAREAFFRPAYDGYKRKEEDKK